MSKKLLIMSILLSLVSLSANSKNLSARKPAAAKQLVCYGGVMDTKMSKHVKLVSEAADPNTYFGYTARRDVGGYLFVAKVSGQEILLSILPDSEKAAKLVDKKVALPFADAELKLSKMATAYVNCSEEGVDGY